MSYMPWYTVTKQSNKCKSIGCSKCQAGWNPRLMKFNQCHHSDTTKPVVQLFAETRFVSENISDVTFNIFHITDNRTVYAYFRRFVVYFFINDMSYCSKLSPTWRPILFKAGIRGHELVWWMGLPLYGRPRKLKDPGFQAWVGPLGFRVAFCICINRVDQQQQRQRWFILSLFIDPPIC